METIDVNGFKIYSDGRIQNSRTGNFLNPSPSSNGYKYVNLNGRKSRKREAIHRLVATYFVPNPENLPVVDHLNGIKTDNRKENLKWTTLSENTSRTIKKIPVKITNQITGKTIYFSTQMKAGQFLNLSQGNISHFCKLGKVKNDWKIENA